MKIRLANTDQDLAACYPVMRELRQVEESEFVSRVRIQEKDGYRLAMVEDGGHVVGVAGFRIAVSLAWGRFLYVDDLVTSGRQRSQGYGAKLLSWLRDYAIAEGCQQLHLDSGLQRVDAHRFYEREGMSKGAFHFAMQLLPSGSATPTSVRREEIELVAITQAGSPARRIDGLPDVASQVLTGTAEMYKAGGYEPPWIGYLAVHDGNCVGTCAFKAPPSALRVEIAYFTFPEYEGRGLATSMARSLVRKARLESTSLRICAQTLPEASASTRVLEKTGFVRVAEVDHPQDGKVWEWEWRPQPADAGDALQRV